MRGVLVGKSSYLAGSLTELPGDWSYLSHHDIDESADLLKSADIVINCALNPALRNAAYDVRHDVDHAIAGMIGPRTFYTMLSSRMVYGEGATGPVPFAETDDCNPSNAYGKNKLAIEQGLNALIGPDRLIVLRLGNIFGFELDRPTFLGCALTSLKNTGKLHFDLAPESVRDFLPAANLGEIMRKVVAKPVAGIYNIGSGVPLSIADITSWLIEGYGKGEVIYTDTSAKGQFILDVRKSARTYGLPAMNKADLEKRFIECGRQLQAQ